MTATPPKRWLRKLRVTRVDLVPRGDNPDAHIALAKARATLPQEDPQVPKLPAELEALTQDEVDGLFKWADDVAAQHAAAAEFIAAHQAEATALTAKADTLAADLAKAQADLAAANGEDPTTLVDKSALSPELRAIVEKGEAAAAEVAKLRAEADNARYTAVAKSLTLVEADADKLGPLLATVAKSVDEATYAEVERILHAAQTRLSTGDLFKEVGGAGGTSDAEQELESAVADYRKAHPDATLPEARVEVLSNDPGLYDRVNKARAEA